MSSQVIGPPPKSLLVDRELYLWLSRIYVVLNGQDSSYELSGDVITSTASSNADGAELAKSVHGVELMQLRAQIGEMQKRIDQLSLMLAQSHAATPDTIPAPMLSMGEINKRIDEALLWQSP